jgi:hypothetical protein
MHQYIGATMHSAHIGDANIICCACHLLIRFRGFFSCSSRFPFWRKMLPCANSNSERPFDGRHLLLKKLPVHLAVVSGNKNIRIAEKTTTKFKDNKSRSPRYKNIAQRLPLHFSLYTTFKYRSYRTFKGIVSRDE